MAMQVWKVNDKDVSQAILEMSRKQDVLAAVITTKKGEKIATERPDAAATQLADGSINAFLRVRKINYENGNLFYDLDYIELFPHDIAEIAYLDGWVAENESPKKYLKPGMRVRIFPENFSDSYEGELGTVADMDIFFKSDNGPVSFATSKLRSVLVLP